MLNIVSVTHKVFKISSLARARERKRGKEALSLGSGMVTKLEYDQFTSVIDNIPTRTKVMLENKIHTLP